MSSKFYSQGIILTGGKGTRLGKLTNTLSKQMLPISDRFVIDYPLNTLRKLGIKNLTVVLGEQHYDQVISYLKSGTDFGFKINYVFQDEPNGISAAINLCEPYITDNMVVILGDNIFKSHIKWNNLDATKHNPFAARIALTKHPELNRFGVASIKNGKIVSIVEKPKELDPALDSYAITGCYMLPVKFFEHFTKTKPSLRGEWEITHILEMFLKEGLLEYSIIDGWWADAGSHQAIDKVRELVKSDPVEF